MPKSHDRIGGGALRLWPGVVAVIIQWLTMIMVPMVAPDEVIVALLAGVALSLVVIVWWLFFSRAPWVERGGAIAVMVVAVVATRQFVDPSISGGMMGMLVPIYSLPVLSLALVVWAVVSRQFPIALRRASMVVAIVIACGVFTVVRTGGVKGDGTSDFHWRWTPTPEQLLIARAASEPAPVPPAPAAPIAAAPEMPGATAMPPIIKSTKDTEAPAVPDIDIVAEWPGFRGADRDSLVRGARIETDWTQSPPVELWRKPIGPGWSSFAVQGNFIYTQEQRGEDEMVSCYSLATGAAVWRHKDAARFYESNGGAGPRGTPALSRGRVYTFGATGILNALDARTGAVVWSRNAAADTKAKQPGWGFSSSPLVVGDVVVVATSGVLAGYDAATGKPRWQGPAHAGSYSSPQLMTIGGVTQVVMLSGTGATGVVPATGAVLWEHEWPGGSIVQPALTEDGDVLINSISMNGGVGLRRLAVVQAPGGAWTATERWTSTGLKPYFNDFVVHNGHAFGFDGNILACIDLTDGKRVWKGGRYGNGQMVLLPDQNLLLVLSEEGELALVSATADKFTEIARFPAIDGKTWNHPVLVGDTLLVRNGEEMAAFRLARK